MASSKTADELLIIINPELAALPTSSDQVELARCQTNACYFGENYEYAVALRAAHTLMLGMTRPLGEVGSISNKSEGSLSLGFGGASSPKGGSPYLSQTTYGMQLQELISGSSPALGVTGENGLQGNFCE